MSTDQKPQGLLDSDEQDSSSDGGVEVNGENVEQDSPAFTINKDYAARFLHNKKREELHKLQEKYPDSKPRNSRANGSTKGRLSENDDSGSEASTSSTSEEEDEEAELITDMLDNEINATLSALKAKDPRIYDKKAVFYSALEDDTESREAPKKQDKPVYLHDYQREKLLRESQDTRPQEESGEPATFAEEQSMLHKTVLEEIDAAAKKIGREDPTEADQELKGDEDFFAPKHKINGPNEGYTRQRTTFDESLLDVSTADRDPETFLSNFMASKAWLPSESNRFQAFESDDDEEEMQADAFENAYNMRFEDPQVSNEKLVSHARDVAAKFSVRKDKVSRRRKGKESQNLRAEAEKSERVEEKTRLRKLKIEETENKLKKIKEAAGLRGDSINEQDWFAFLDEGWENDRWEQEMEKRFGKDYYEDIDGEGIIDEDEGARKKRKLSKPKWDDDIDIGDIVPDFEMEEVPQAGLEPSDDEAAGQSQTSNPKRRRLQDRQEQKREARRQRRKVEAFVDEKLLLDTALPASSKSSSKKASRFPYRETSPTSYGLTAADILMASDSQLNQYAGLKKLAAFRDSDKKQRDKKRLSKKARLREWRRETFGREEGPDILQKDEASKLESNSLAKQNGEEEGEEKTGKKKRRRSRKSKATGQDVQVKSS